jgi:hypothetical protein
MNVIASVQSVSPKPAPKQLTYGDVIGQVISSIDLTQGYKSAYLIIQHPEFLQSVMMISMEFSKGALSTALKSSPLGTGYVVRPDATLVLEGLK